MKQSQRDLREEKLRITKNMAANRVIVLENGEVFVCISGCCLFSCRENGKNIQEYFDLFEEILCWYDLGIYLGL